MKQQEIEEIKTKFESFQMEWEKKVQKRIIIINENKNKDILKEFSLKIKIL
jgi:hypothetical protein